MELSILDSSFDSFPQTSTEDQEPMVLSLVNLLTIRGLLIDEEEQ